MKRSLVASSVTFVSIMLTACNPVAPPVSESTEPASTAVGDMYGSAVDTDGSIPDLDVSLTDPNDSASDPQETPIPQPTVDLVVDEPSVTGAFPGDVAAGYVRFGAAIHGNDDPVARHETTAGRAMGIRRTFWRWDQRTTSMIRTARGDLAAGRVPWVSVKTPGWAAMASGAHDAEIDSMLAELATLDGPVWLTVHHEPEGGGGIPGPDDPGGAGAWRAMQTRVRDRMTAMGVTNVAFASILMAWTFDPRSNRVPDEWWVDGIWDFAGIDTYVDKESETTFENRGWNNARAFYTRKGMKIAVGEWGNRGTDKEAAGEVQAFYDMAVDSGFSGQSQVIGLSAFDSNLNSPKGGWELKGEQLTKFRELMLNPTSLNADRNGF